MIDSATIRSFGRFPSARRRAALLTAAFAIAAAGCAARPGAGVATLSTTVPASSALILPAPGTWSIVSVVQRQYTNAIEQQVALSTEAATPGQNFLGIQVFGPAETVAMPGGTLAYKPVQHAAIRAEIARYFPGRTLAISPHFVRNNYGPFGYAYGAGAGGDGCLYGWQQIRSDNADRDIRGNQGMIQVRLRACQAGASEKDLVQQMYGFTIVGGFSGAVWNPYGTPPGVGEVGGGEPLAVPLEDGAVRPRRVTATPERIRQETGRTTQRRQTAEDAILVPSPSGSVSGEAVVVPSPVCVTDAAGAATCD